MGVASRLREEQILDDDEVKLLHGLKDLLFMRITLHDIFSHEPQPSDLAGHGGAKHEGAGETWFLRRQRTPDLTDAGTHLGIANGLIASEVGGHAPHIRAALHVILSS